MRLFLFVVMLLGLSLCSYGQQGLAQASRDYSQAADLIHQKKFDEALLLLNNAAQVYHRTARYLEEARCYNLVAGAYFSLGKYNDAISAARKIIVLAPDKIPADCIEVGRGWYHLGSMFRYISKPDSGFIVFQKALPIYERQLSPTDLELVPFYTELSQTYFYKLDYDRAARYRLKNLAMLNKLPGDHKLDIAVNHNNLARIYVDALELDQARYHIEKAIEIFKAESSPKLAYCYNLAAQVCRQTGEYEKSIEFLKKSDALNRKNPDPYTQMYRIMDYRDMGEVYILLGEYELSRRALDDGLVLAKKLFGERHPAITSVYTRRGIALQKMGRYDEAIHDFQQSLISNSDYFNNMNPYTLPRSTDVVDFAEGITLLQSMGEALREKYHHTKRKTDLQGSLNAYELMDSILHAKRIAIMAQVDKIRLGRYNVIYEDAIKTCLELYDATHDEKYLHRAFYFAEKNKANLMGEILSEAFARNEGIIPQTIREVETKIHAGITSTNSAIQRIRSSSQPDQKKLKEEEDKLFRLDISADSIKRTLERDYPKYYQAKYQEGSIAVKDLQKLLSPNTLMLEYFEGNSMIYVFMISRDHFEVKPVLKDSRYDSLLQRFDESIRPATAAVLYSEKTFQNFVQSSQSLYDVLIHDDNKKIWKAVSNLVIIPDGRLSYIPFEILVTAAQRGATGDYASLPYLLKKYSISYGYSATLHARHITQATGKSASDIISFAPSYTNLIKPNEVQLNLLGEFRDDVGTLRWNQDEVKNIQKIFGGKYYLAEEATEKQFKQLAGRYDVIHLAMHALADDKNPMNSRLVFTQDWDSLEDGFLHAFELYNMKLNAHMVVLSACNTGYGTLANGEGIMNLGRAFAYAGVPSLVTSHWKVDDEATSILMEQYYAYLSEGMDKAEALRQAKLTYLENADPAKAHPFYWGAFVTVGDTRALVSSTSWIFITTILAVIALLAGLGFWYWKRRS